MHVCAPAADRTPHLNAGSSGMYMSSTPAENAMPWQYPASMSCRLYALRRRNSDAWPPAQCARSHRGGV